jgi:NitT/TauT family transport system permease protein/sulfonate transport system permease protein
LLLLGIMGFLADQLFDRTVRALLPWYGAEQGDKPGRSS